MYDLPAFTSILNRKGPLAISFNQNFFFFTQGLSITISNYILYFTISGTDHYILWWLAVAENRTPCIFCYAISMFPSFQEQARSQQSKTSQIVMDRI
jgi:hypothetical protein